MFNGTVRLLQERDAPAVKDIFKLHWEQGFVNHLSDKLDRYVRNDGELKDQEFRFFVAEENSNVVGTIAMRKAPEHMKAHTITANPAEFYVIAVKDKNRGIGSALKAKVLEEGTREGYTEGVFFSAVSHKDAWEFHDRNFERVGPAVAPNGEEGYVWRKYLN